MYPQAPQSPLQNSHSESPAKAENSIAGNLQTNLCIQQAETASAPVPEKPAERKSSSSFTDHRSCNNCVWSGSHKCNLFLNKKFAFKKKMSFPMSAFIISGVGVLFLCTVLSVTIEAVETEIKIKPEGNDNLQGVSQTYGKSPARENSRHLPDVTRLNIIPLNKVYVTHNEFVVPIISLELLEKIKYLISIPIEFIQWLIPPIILLKQFMMTFILFLIKLLDVRNDFHTDHLYPWDESELDDSWSREL